MTNTYSLDLERGSSQYASIASGSQTGLGITGSITIEAWVKPESFPVSSGERHTIVHRRVSASGGYWFNFRNNGGNQQLELAITDSGGTTDFLVSTHSLSTGKWYHVAAVWDVSDGDVDFYINGALHANVAGSKTNIGAPAKTFTIGGDADGASDFFDGLISEVRVWSSTRTAQNIADNVTEESIGNESGLVGYWKFNNDYLDVTSNNNDLTSSGSPVFSSGDVPYGTTYEQSFDALSSADLDTQDSWARSTGSANTQTVQSTIAFTGKAVDVSGACVYTRGITGRTSGIVSLYHAMRCDTAPPSGDGLFVQMREVSSSKYGAAVKFVNSSPTKIQYLKTGGWADLLASATLSTWYIIQMEFDVSRGNVRYRYKEDGGSWSTWTSWAVGFSTTVGTIDRYATGEDSGQHYYDELSATEPTAFTPTAVVSSPLLLMGI